MQVNYDGHERVIQMPNNANSDFRKLLKAISSKSYKILSYNYSYYFIATTYDLSTFGKK